jgi:hypothetical protein
VDRQAMHFQPWKGDNYDNGYFSGLKLLILGESFYETEDPLIVRHHLGCAINRPDGENREQRFWAGIEQIVTGRKLNQMERLSFWHGIAFSNLIQDWLDSSNQKPTNSNGKELATHFLKL